MGLQTAMTAGERAKHLARAINCGQFGIPAEEVRRLLTDVIPPGSIILTADEAETVRDELRGLLVQGEDGQLHDPDCVGVFGYDCRERLCGGVRRALRLLGGGRS